MQLKWRGLAGRIADLAALDFKSRRDVRRPRRSRTLRLQTEALESRNMLAWHPLLFAPHRPHTAAPAVHNSAPAHTSSTSGSQTSTTAGTLRLSGPSSGSAGTLLALGAVSIQGGTTINTGTLTISAANTYTGSVLVQNGSLGTGTVNLQGGTLSLDSAGNSTGTISVAGTSLANLTYPGTISLTAGTLSGGVLELASAPSVVNDSSLTISGGTLRFNPTSGLGTLGTGVTVNVGGTGTLELAGTVSTLSPNNDRVNIVNLSSQPSTGRPGEAGWLDGTGSTIVNSGATLTANNIVQNALVINNTPFNNGILTIAPSDATGNPLAGQLQLALAPSLVPPGSDSTLAPVNTTPALPYYWSQPG
jgi:autotransporter-associated beta strand protein